MKVTFEVDTDNEDYTYRAMIDAVNMRMGAEDFKQYLRSMEKHGIDPRGGELSESEMDLVEKIYDRFYQEIGCFL